MAPEITKYIVERMCCAEEGDLLCRHLKKQKGIGAVVADVAGQTVAVNHTCSGEEVVRAIQSAGFTVREKNNGNEKLDDPEFKRQSFFTVISAVLLILGLIAEFAGAESLVTKIIFMGAIIGGGWKIALTGYYSLRRLSLDMNFLMSVAALCAVFIGKWGEAATVIVLFSVSLLIERYAIRRTRKEVTDLMKVAPAEATVIRNGAEEVVDVREVIIGENILIRPGERIPVDGTVLSGDSSVIQAPITGESVPVVKRAGDKVFAGSLNERGLLRIVSEKLYDDNVISRIVRRVEEARSERAEIQTATEKFARYYTPSVFILAILLSVIPPLLFGGIFSQWLYRSLVLLVIACPCALVISTPVTIVCGLARAARNGVLIKSGRVLENIAKIRALAFDKTGTLTEGKPHVTDVISLNNLTDRKIIELAASVEYRSEHPLAGAILRKAYEENSVIDPPAYQHFESLTGKGIRVSFDGKIYYLGNHDLIHEKGICTPRMMEVLERLEKDGKTVIILATENEPLGVIGIRDRIRKGADEAIRNLRKDGIEKVIMVTGDNEAVAAGIADSLALDGFYAGVLPEEKLEIIRGLREKYRSVAMVGDGINDAPALAASDIGIAMGDSGTDIALESADVILMSDDLSRLPFLRKLGTRTYSILIQNIVLSLSTKLIFLVLGAFGAATLWTAILADDGAALLVILNGLRVIRTPREDA